jgi:methylmalonyl-CoA mutase
MSQKLFSEFSHTTSQQWKDQLTKDLKGIDFEKLLWATSNRMHVKPFYTAEDVKEIKQPVFNHTDWDICEHILVIDEKEANEKALIALAGGASGLVFFINKKINTSVLIKDISIEHIYTQFFISNDALHVLEDLKVHYAKENSHDGTIKCFVNIDPLSMYAFYGEWHTKQEEDLLSLTQLQHIPLNATLYQEAGANNVNELAIALAHLNEYFNYLEEKNQLNKKCIHASLSIGGDFFAEIAKLRAFKQLVALLQKQYSTNISIHLQTQTTQINNSSSDANNNMLRTTTEAMSAILGGCNSLVVFPYNFIYEQTTEFSNRMARNQQHILKEESYLNKMADVSAGSYYIETLTESIAQLAWEQFKTIEAKGGFIACLKNNFIQDLIATDANTAQEKINSSEMVLVGVNKYQAKNEVVKASSVLSVAATNEIKSIKPIRYGVYFEK